MHPASPIPIRPAKRKPAAPAWRRRLPLAGALLLAAAIVIGLWPRPVPVESGVVSQGPLVVTVDEEGITRVQHRFVVSTPVAGQLRRIDWKPGAEIVAGRTVLAVLEATGADFLDARSVAQAEARVRATEAAAAAAQAQHTRAQAAARTFAAELERARRLRGDGVLSVQEFDAVQLRAETAAQDERAAEFASKVSEYELQQARAVLMRGEGGTAPAEPLALTSPVSGRILRVLQESGRVVPAGFPLMEVGDPTDLEVRIEVLSRDAVAIRPGARALLELWGGPEPLAARVRLVEPSAFTKISALGVEEQRVFVIADLVDPPAGRPTLGDGFRVEARIVTWEKPDALRVPAGAVFQRQGGWQAYVIENRRARLRAVKLGRSNGIESEILEGLRAGERVIVYPGDKVTDGARVTALEIGAR